ncbi:hypothetical protein [Rhizobium gallicum]|uniref:hypothetical protein n=1 Tax=Rhizobium gallicum TaxID=56730 RepID=UPI0026805C89
MLLAWILSAGIVVTTQMAATNAIFGGLTPLVVASLLPINPMASAYCLLFIAVLAFILGLYLMPRATASKPISASRSEGSGWRRGREEDPYGTRVRPSSRPYRIACSFSSKRCICALSGVA